MKRKALPWLLALLMLVVAFAVYYFNRRGERRGAGISVPTVVRFASEGQLVTFDPHLQNESATWGVLCNIYEGLVYFDENLKVEPGLAVSWSNPDPLHWLFRLRPNVRFHNGKPLVAADVVYSIRRSAYYEKSAISSQLASIQDVSAPQADLITVETRYPDPVLLNKLTFAVIVPAQESFNYPAIASQPEGTGPYRLDHWLSDTSFLLRHFDGYWGKGGSFPLAEIHFISSDQTRLAALLDGQLDLARGFHWEQYNQIRQNPRLATRITSSLGVMVMGFRVTPLTREGNEPGNPLVRREVRTAINLALDRDQLVRRTFGGLGRIATQYATSEVFGYDHRLDMPKRDLPHARRLLAEAGFAAGFTMDLHVSQNVRPLGEVVQENLGEIGVRVRLRVMPWRDIYQLIASDQPPQAVIFGFSCSSGDISDFLDSCLHTRLLESRSRMGELNPTGYKNPELDRWIEESRQMMNLQERKDLLYRIQRQALEDLPFVPLTSNLRIFGYVRQLDWVGRPDARVDLNRISWKGESGEVGNP